MQEEHNYEQFSIELWGQVSTTIISEQVYDLNRDFFQNMTYEFYTMHVKSDGTISVKTYARLMECVIVNFFRFGFES